MWVKVLNLELQQLTSLVSLVDDFFGMFALTSKQLSKIASIVCMDFPPNDESQKL